MNLEQRHQSGAEILLVFVTRAFCWSNKPRGRKESIRSVGLAARGATVAPRPSCSFRIRGRGSFRIRVFEVSESAGDSEFPNPTPWQFPNPRASKFPNPGGREFPNPRATEFPNPWALKFPNPRAWKFPNPWASKFPNPGGQGVSESEGQGVSESEGLEVSESVGFEVSESGGQRVSESDALGVSESVGLEVSESEGLQVSESEGFEVSESGGQEVSESEGQGVSESDAEVSESGGEGVSESEGLGVSESDAEVSRIRSWPYNYGWLVVWNMAFIFHNTRDNPSQLTFIFFRGVETTNQCYIGHMFGILTTIQSSSNDSGSATNYSSTVAAWMWIPFAGPKRSWPSRCLSEKKRVLCCVLQASCCIKHKQKYTVVVWSVCEINYTCHQRPPFWDCLRMRPPLSSSSPWNLSFVEIFQTHLA